MDENKTATREGYTIRDQTLPHFITATLVDWIDVFTRGTYRDTGLLKIEKVDNPIVDVLNPNSFTKYNLY